MKLAAVLACALILVASSGLMGLQTWTPAERPSFEVASLKPDNGKSGGIEMGSHPGGLFRETNVSLKMLVKQAYHLEDFQIFGAPDWIDSARFDIVAEAGKSVSQEQMELMLQSLIENRFLLRFHRGEKEMPVYVLTVAKNGPKLEVVNDGVPLPSGVRHGPSSIRSGQLIMQKTPISQLAAMLSTQLGRPIVDKTGIEGVFNIKLVWVPDSLTGDGSGAAPDPAGASLFTAIQEQLGLKLDSQKSPIGAFIIDSAQKPVEN